MYSQIHNSTLPSLYKATRMYVSGLTLVLDDQLMCSSLGSTAFAALGIRQCPVVLCVVPLANILLLSLFCLCLGSRVGETFRVQLLTLQGDRVSQEMPRERLLTECVSITLYPNSEQVVAEAKVVSSVTCPVSCGSGFVLSYCPLTLIARFSMYPFPLPGRLSHLLFLPCVFVTFSGGFSSHLSCQHAKKSLRRTSHTFSFLVATASPSYKILCIY